MAEYGTATYGSGHYGSIGPVSVSATSTVAALVSKIEGPAVVSLGAVGVAASSTFGAVLGSDAAVAAAQSTGWPDVVVELGLQSGSGLFTLDDSTFGRLGTGVLADGQGYVWTDITEWVQHRKKLGLSRGSKSNTSPYFQMKAGRVSFELKNIDGRFDPDNLDGPYVSGGVTALRPNIPVRVCGVYGAAREMLFTGKVTDWTGNYP